MFPPKKILRSVVIFILAYLVSLTLWIQVKPYYGAVMTRLGSECAATFSDFRLDAHTHDNETSKSTFSRLIISRQGTADLAIDIAIKVSNYTFNIPLTIALVAALIPIISWNIRTMVEVAVLLISIHFAYVFFNTCLQLFYYAHPGQADASLPATTVGTQYFLEFTWVFIDNMVVRFEPFLVALYLIFKSSRKQSQKISSGE